MSMFSGSLWWEHICWSLISFGWFVTWRKTTFLKRGEVGVWAAECIKCRSVLWDWPTKMTPKKTTFGGQGFFVFLLLFWSLVGTFCLVYDVEPSCIGEMCNEDADFRWGAEWRHFITLRQKHFLRRALGKDGISAAQVPFGSMGFWANLCFGRS